MTKPTPTSPDALRDAPVSLLAFGAHPDDIEFGCGGVIARETREGRSAHFVVCSRGEAATNGDPAVRQREAEASAALLGATVEFVELDGDAHLEERVEHALVLAAILRRLRPAIVLAPTLVENQHPDHVRLGRLVQRAARLARYGGVKELLGAAPHAIGQLFYYAVTPDAEPSGALPVVVDVSEAVGQWREAMDAHLSQSATRSYSEFQLARARVLGARAGVGHAIALYPNDPVVVNSLAALAKGARNF